MEGKEIFIPGRLCILGEHSDWAAEYVTDDETGMVLVCATNEGISARVNTITDKILKYDCSTSDGKQISFSLPLNVDELDKEAKLGGFGSYIAGTAAEILSSNDFKKKYSDSDSSKMTGIHINNPN